MKARALGSLAVALIACCLASPAHAADRHTHTITYDRYSFSLDGQRVWLWSAEFHYGFHSADAAPALVLLTCGAITLQPPHELHLHR